MIRGSVIPAFAAAVTIGLAFGCGGNIQLFAAAPLSDAANQPSELGDPTSIIRLAPDSDRPGGRVFEVSGVVAQAGAPFSAEQLKGIDWSRIFAVYVASSSLSERQDLPPIAGSYLFEAGILKFKPRFPVEKGVRYRAVFFPKRARFPNGDGQDKNEENPSGNSEESITAEFLTPLPPSVRSAFVENVFPTVDVLPENQLKFYLYFSAPMSRGQGYTHIHLFGEDGKSVDLPFLEIDEELWDPKGTRLTLFFDPGRIKRGVRPREELGPTLRVGERYTFVIDSNWQDANGNPLIREYRKVFRVGEADYDSPSPKDWKLELPAEETQEPLVVRFNESLDIALASRLIWVETSDNQYLSGSIDIADGERQWRFVPTRNWTPGDYHLIVGTVLEDLAGNSVARPFEVDAFPPVQQRIEQETVSRSFQISGRNNR